MLLKWGYYLLATSSYYLTSEAVSLNLRSNLLRSNYYCCCFEVVVGLEVQRLPVRKHKRYYWKQSALSNKNVSLAKGSLIQKFCTSNLQKRCQKYPTHFPLRWKCSGKGFFTFFRGIKVRVKTFLRLSYLYIKRLLSYHNFFSLESKSQHITYKLIEIPEQSSWSKCLIKKGEKNYP